MSEHFSSAHIAVDTLQVRYASSPADAVSRLSISLGQRWGSEKTPPHWAYPDVRAELDSISWLL